MTLHPDILTDLVILYHAGEASQASRALLEDEAARSPQLAAALAAPSRAMAPLPAHAAPDERVVLRRVRLRYQAFAFAAVWILAAFSIMLFPRVMSPGPGVALAINFIPLALLCLFAAAAVGALYFAVSARR